MSLETDRNERLNFAVEMARESGELILTYYQKRDLKIEKKRDRSLVTEADKNAELLIRREIEKKFPTDNIIGEEFGEIQKGGVYTWILDPIDGTQSFTCGVPLFGTLIGCSENSNPVLGVANFPALKEIYYGSTGQGAWWMAGADRTPRRARVSEVSELSEALFCTTYIKGFETSNRARLFEQVHSNFGQYRGWSDCYGYVLVATGRAEMALDALMNIWDCAALAPILWEAGGYFGDFKGHSCIDGGEALACNANLKSKIFQIVENSI